MWGSGKRGSGKRGYIYKHGGREKGVRNGFSFSILCVCALL